MNIFLVEDEPWALEELTVLMKVYEPDHRIFAFESGDEALASIDTVHPDLVITDIRMPGMDGLEMVRRMKKYCPDMQAIALSGYDEFEYARRGLRLGIQDYLLKSVRRNTLYGTVERVLQTITATKRQRKKQDEWTLTRLFLGTGEDFEKRSAAHLPGRWCIVLLVCENWNSKKSWHTASIDRSAVTDYLRTNICREHYIVDLDAHRRVVMWTLPEKRTLSQVREEVFSFHDWLNESGDVIHTSYALKEQGDDLREVFHKLSETLEQQMKLSLPTFADPTRETEMIDLEETWEKVRFLELHIRNFDTRKIKTEVRRILADLKRKGVTINHIASFLLNVLFALSFNLTQSVRSTSEKDGEEIVSFLRSVSRYEEIEDWLYEKVLELVKGLPEGRSPKQLVQMLIDRVRSPDRSDISLQEFAAEHHVSLGYLSRLFKKETGMNFSQFLTEKRIEKARKYLLQSDLRLSEISELVGYDDAKYFSQLFKKHTGLAPHEYRKTKRKKNQPR